jgi:hypothetical protein
MRPYGKGNGPPGMKMTRRTARLHPMSEPLIVHWRGHQVRVRHDDPTLGVYTGTGQQLRAAIELASDVDGLRLVLASTVGERYRVRVSDDGSVVGLWRMITT